MSDEVKLRLWLATLQNRKFEIGDRVRAKRDAWQGHICGFYSSPLSQIGYNVLSEREKKSVHIYAESALELVPEED